jgi:EmrB/QacA subfamily drug resistance transporter
VLTAMIFAVAMTFIDQTIVSIAAPKIQSELALSSTGLQWAINSYLLALAALFAFGGRLADIVGPRRMVTIGIVVFAGASLMCGLTPTGGIAETWLVTFRAVQGVGGALMYPAALAIVVTAYPANERGKALALFFGIAGGLTAVGPAAGGYLTLWTWRAIFWINIPVALIALVLIAKSEPAQDRRPAPIDYRGLVLITVGVALSVFGFQQSALWGWGNPATALSIAVGAVLLIAFVRLELRTTAPLMNMVIFANRGFRVDNMVLLVSMTVFVPVFFFASEYGQIALGEKPQTASLMLLYFFAGFVTAAQVGGRMLDRVGARRPIVLGCVLAAVALQLWAHNVESLSLGKQVWFIVLTGAGLGLMLGQANTDALNRAPSTSYGEATGITQTVRNFGSSLGLAILGTILVTQLRTHLTSTLIASGMPSAAAHHQASRIAQLGAGAGAGNGNSKVIPHFVQLDFADATRTVLTVMSWVMVVAAAVALVGLPRRVRATG